MSAEIFDDLVEGILGINANLEITYANQSLARIFNWTQGVTKLDGRRPSEICALGSVLESYARDILKDGQSMMVEQSAPGTEKVEIYRIQFSPRFDSQKKICGVTAVLREESKVVQNIEDLKKAKARLEAQTKALNLFDIVAETDPRGRITFANDKFCEISKYTRDELIGKDHRILNSKEHSKEFMRDLWQSIQKGKVWTGEIKNVAKDGSYYWVNTVIAPVFDEHGILSRFLAIRRDITAQKEAEERFKISEQRYRQLIENIHHVAVGFDLNRKITFANQNFMNLTGWKEEELIGKNWESFFEKDSMEVSQSERAEGKIGHYGVKFESEISKKNGEKARISWTNTQYFNTHGNFVGITSIGEDITARYLREKELAEERERSRKQREAVVAFISHELRSPLMSIRSGFDTIQMALEDRGQIDAKLAKLVGLLNQHIERIDFISRDLLNSVFYQETNLEFKPKMMNLNELLVQIIERFKVEVANKDNLKMETKILDAPVEGLWDRNRLDQAISNLIVNAIKYSKPSGGKIKVSLQIQNRMAIIEVSDTGLGVPAEYRERIFEMFSRADNVVGRGIRGYGLGLKITKDIVERLKGSIVLESELDVGSTFKILLPIHSAS